MTDGAERITQRRVRALRGTAAAAVAVLFASTAHTLSGGDAPPLWLILGVTILAAPLCIALVGRRRSLARSGLAVAAAQLALHAAFAAVGAAAPADAPAAMPGSALRGHEHVMAMLGATTMDPAATTMTIGHGLAALVTFVVLAWSEAAAAAISRGIRHLLRRVPAHAAPHPAATPPVASAPAPVPAAVFLACVTRRGPPAHSALASFA